MSAEHRVGDLVWGKQQGFSWWPCIVTYDPDYGLFTKTAIDKKSASKAQKQTVHVQFLGHERPSRAWLNSTALQPWSETREEHLKQKIKDRLLPDWNRALAECEKSCALGRAQRIGRHAPVFGRPDSDDETDGNDADENAGAEGTATSAQPQTVRPKWTKGMDAKLMKLILLQGGPKGWNDITKRMGYGLSAKQIQYHWRGVLKTQYENGNFEKLIKKYTAAAREEGIDLAALLPEASAAQAAPAKACECQICNRGTGIMLACASGCGSYFHRACIGLARTPKKFVCDLCCLKHASTDDAPPAQLPVSHKAAGEMVPPASLEADTLQSSGLKGDAEKDGSKKQMPEPGDEANDTDMQEEDDDDELCVVCSSGADSARMLLCDGCDDGYHLDCLKPKMKGIPSGAWFCPTCSQARKKCGACNGSQRAHTCGTVGRSADESSGEVQTSGAKRTRAATAACGGKRRRTGATDRESKSPARRQAHAADIESIAALNQSIAGYADSAISGGGRSKRASTAASTKATDFLRVAQVVQDELDQNVCAPQSKEDEEQQKRVAIWNKSKRVIIKGWKAPMKKHLQKFLGSHPDCEVYDSQDQHDVAAAAKVATATSVTNNAGSREGDDRLLGSSELQSDPAGKKGTWCSQDVRQCKLCRLGVGWCKRRGKGGHLPNPGKDPLPLEEPPKSKPLPNTRVSSMTLARPNARADPSVISQRQVQGNSVSRRAEKLIEQEKIHARRNWSTQQVLLQWSTDMESVHNVDRVARNLKGRWARGSSDSWERPSKTPTPKESAAALLASRQFASTEIVQKQREQAQAQAQAQELVQKKQEQATQICQKKIEPKPGDHDPCFQRVELWNTRTQRRLTGNNRPMRKDLDSFLKRLPHYVPYAGQDTMDEEATTVAHAAQGRPWDNNEDEALLGLIHTHGVPSGRVQWADITRRLGSRRSQSAVETRWTRYLRTRPKAKEVAPQVSAAEDGGHSKAASSVESTCSADVGGIGSTPAGTTATANSNSNSSDGLPTELPIESSEIGATTAAQKQDGTLAEGNSRSQRTLAAERAQAVLNSAAAAPSGESFFKVALKAVQMNDNSRACGKLAAPVPAPVLSAPVVQRGSPNSADVGRPMNDTLAASSTTPDSGTEHSSTLAAVSSTAPSIEAESTAATDEITECTKQQSSTDTDNTDDTETSVVRGPNDRQAVGATAADTTRNIRSGEYTAADTQVQQTQTPTLLDSMSSATNETSTLPNSTAVVSGSLKSRNMATTATKNTKEISEDVQSTSPDLSTAAPRATTPPLETSLPEKLAASASAAVECIDLLDDSDGSEDGDHGDMVATLVEEHARQPQSIPAGVTVLSSSAAALPTVPENNASVTNDRAIDSRHNHDSASTQRYEVGQRLSMRFQLTDGNQAWYPGTIAKIQAGESGSARFDISFDDGGKESNVYATDPDLVIEWPAPADRTRGSIAPGDSVGVLCTSQDAQKREHASIQSEAEVAAKARKRKRSSTDAYPPVGTQVRVKTDDASDSLGRPVSRSVIQKWGGQTGCDHGFVRVLFSPKTKQSTSSSDGADAEATLDVNQQHKPEHGTCSSTVAVRMLNLEILSSGSHDEHGAQGSQRALADSMATNASQSSDSDASSTAEGGAPTSLQRQASSAQAGAIAGSGERPRGRERKLSRRLVECLESM